MWTTVSRETTANCHVITTPGTSPALILPEFKHEQNCYSSKHQAYFVQIWLQFCKRLKLQRDRMLFYRWILQIKISSPNIAVSDCFCGPVSQVLSFILQYLHFEQQCRYAEKRCCYSHIHTSPGDPYRPGSAAELPSCTSPFGEGLAATGVPQELPVWQAHGST